MANKFKFGALKHIVTDALFAGRQHKQWGHAYIAAAYFEPDYTGEYGFGEIVEIVGDLKTNYRVKPIDATTTESATFAVIMNEITGAQTIHAGTVNNGIPNVPLNIWPLIKENKGTIIVPVVEGATTKVVIGGAVYVGTGASGTIIGSAYSQNVTGTVLLTDAVFTTKATQPTLDEGLTVAIGFKL